MGKRILDRDIFSHVIVVLPRKSDFTLKMLCMHHGHIFPNRYTHPSGDLHSWLLMFVPDHGDSRTTKLCLDTYLTPLFMTIKIYSAFVRPTYVCNINNLILTLTLTLTHFLCVWALDPGFVVISDLVGQVPQTKQTRGPKLKHTRNELGLGLELESGYTFCRRILEYGSTLFMGSKPTHLTKLDSVQATMERIGGFKAQPLANRREAALIALSFKQLDGDHECREGLREYAPLLHTVNLTDGKLNS